VDADVYEVTLAHVLIEPEPGHAAVKPDPLPLEDAIVESPVEGLDLVPSDIRLARFEMQADYLTHRLRSQLREHADHYDLVFIDCPPQLGKLLTTALYSAHYVLIPCSADAMGLHGLADLSFTIHQVRKNVNSDLQILGAVINLYKPQRNLSSESRLAVEAATELIGYVFDTNIHDYSKIAEAPSQKLPTVLYAKNHRSADQFWSLTDEVLDKLKMTRNKIAAVK
jgi:chromosome partitioning protein